MIVIRLKFNSNRFTSTCCSTGTRLDVLSDNTVPPEERNDVDEKRSCESEDQEYSTPRSSERGTSSLRSGD